MERFGNLPGIQFGLKFSASKLLVAMRVLSWSAQGVGIEDIA